MFNHPNIIKLLQISHHHFFFSRMEDRKNAAWRRRETRTIKILFLLALIMLFSSLVAISYAVYNFPQEGCNYQSSVNGLYDVEMETWW